MSSSQLYRLISLHEGVRTKMYKCPAGFNTIGVGHNLDANPISERAVAVIFEDDILDVEQQLNRALPWWKKQDPIRQMALIDLCFNLGIGSLCGFFNTLRAWESGDYESAARGLEASKWFRQVGNRGPRIVAMVRTGKFPSDVA